MSSAITPLIQGNETLSAIADDDNEIFVGKIVLMLLIGPITFLASLVHWMIEKKFSQRMEQILAFGSALSAGVILGAGFSHILPDARESFEAYYEQSGSDWQSYPFAELLAIIVFFLLISLDKLVIDKLLHSHHSLEHEEKLLDHPPSLENHLAVSFAEFQENNQNPNHGLKNKKIGTAYLFLLAISVHSVFDGLSIGSENSKWGFYGVLIAVCSHKLLDGLALGIPIYNAKFSKFQSCACLLLSSLMTPFGILTGWLLSYSQNNLITAILLSLSLGSFIYISLIELLPAALSDQKYIHWKLLTAFLSWAFMAIIAIWV
jgi:solute carrier family 39 (zinc transporter), member 1/2/3